MKQKIAKYKLFFCAALLLFVLMQIFTLSRRSPVWWDESVYIGMGKYIFSGGTAGLWEEIRPPVMPLLSGLLWKAGLNPLLYGRIVVFLLSLGVIFLTYLIGKRAFGEKESLFAAAMLAFTNVFFYFSTLLLSDIVSLFFALLAVYLFISVKSEKHLFFSGIFAAVSFLARFPEAIVSAAIIVSLALSENRKAKGIILRLRAALDRTHIFIYGFLLLLIPYFLSNYYLYNSFFKPFLAANKIIAESYSWLYNFGYMYYFKELVLQNPFLVFSIAGVIYFLKGKLWRKKEKVIVFIAPLLFLAYFTFLNHKEARYVLIFLPYLFVLASYGFFKTRRIMKTPAHSGVLSFVLLIFAAAVLGSLLLQDVDRIKYIEDAPAFEKNISEIDFGNSPVFSTTPMVGVYSDALIKPIYYSLTYAQNNYEAIHNTSGFVVFSTCDFPCEEGDAACPAEINRLVSDIKANSKTLYYSKDARCEHYIFKKS